MIDLMTECVAYQGGSNIFVSEVSCAANGNFDFAEGLGNLRGVERLSFRPAAKLAEKNGAPI